jgi:glycosyltransferase involved in cell wall biosynthesis
MVQVESMFCGTPVVASDLPGVRQPTNATGMGLTVPPEDPGALASAILEILSNPDRFIKPRTEIARHYSAELITDKYVALFQSLLENKG